MRFRSAWWLLKRLVFATNNQSDIVWVLICWWTVSVTKKWLFLSLQWVNFLLRQLRNGIVDGALVSENWCTLWACWLWGWLWGDSWVSLCRLLCSSCAGTIHTNFRSWSGLWSRNSLQSYYIYASCQLVYLIYQLVLLLVIFVLAFLLSSVVFLLCLLVFSVNLNFRYLFFPFWAGDRFLVDIYLYWG